MNFIGAKKYVPACLLLGPPTTKANGAQSKQKMNLVWLWLSYRRCRIGYKSSMSRAQSPEHESAEGGAAWHSPAGTCRVSVCARRRGARISWLTEGPGQMCSSFEVFHLCRP